MPAPDKLHFRHLKDGRPRHFNIVEEHADHLILREQNTGVYWHFYTPLSVGRVIEALKKERKLASAVGLRLSGEMSGHLSTLRWIIR